MVFVADDLGAWLVGLLTDASRRKLSTLVLGSVQERELRQAAAAAVERTALELAPAGGEQAGQLAMVVGEVFCDPAPEVALAGQGTLLGVSGGVLAETLAGHLIREIIISGSRGGSLAPLADQLNHDVTHLQGQRLEGLLSQLAGQVMELPRAGGGLEAPRKPVRLPPRPVFLAGREALLAEAGTRLTAGDDPAPRLVALCGLGGAGKTSVAVECAYRHLAEVAVAWQFLAEDVTVLAARFGELAAQLGARGRADVGDPVASVHAVLARFTGPWLLIFDNAADMASVAGFLPPAGPGRVLITSRNPNWPPGQVLDVPVLDIEIAAGFLVRRTVDPEDQAAAELAAELGGLPLALEQAAAYIQASGGGLASYLALFRRRRADMLGRGKPAGYSQTVATTWRLAFEHLKEAAPHAVGLLRLLAFCAPEAIPLRLLLQPRHGLAERLGEEVVPVLAPLLEDELAAGDAIAALRQYSLVTPAASGTVSVHRLVQAVTADQMPAELASQSQQAAAAIIEAAIPADTEQPEAWPICALLLPHAQKALAQDSKGMTRIANYLGSIGSYAAARDLYEQVYEAQKRVIGTDDPRTLTTRHELAHWTRFAGDGAAARDQYDALLPVYERVFGPEHETTLKTRGWLADLTGDLGDPAAARDLFAELLPVDERVLGPERPETLAISRNLATWTGEAGDPAAARDLFAERLPVEERVLGPEHPRTFVARANDASFTGEAGNPGAARDLFAELLPMLERVLGPKHHRTQAACADCAYWTERAGRGPEV